MDLLDKGFFFLILLNFKVDITSWHVEDEGLSDLCKVIMIRSMQGDHVVTYAGLCKVHDTHKILFHFNLMKSCNKYITCR